MPSNSARHLSLPKSVALAGGCEAWNEQHPELRQMLLLLDRMCGEHCCAALQEVQRS